MSQRSDSIENDYVDENSPNASGAETLGINNQQTTVINYLSSTDTEDYVEEIRYNETNNTNSLNSNREYSSPEITERENIQEEITNNEIIPNANNETISQREMSSGDNNQTQNVNQRARRWIFTWNNPPPNWGGILAQLTAVKQLQLEFIIGCLEHGEERQTPHIQGFARFKKQVYYATLRSKIACFWEVARGSESQNIDYCTKQNGEKFTWGKPATEESKKTMSAEARVESLRKDVIEMNWQQFEDAHPVESTYQKNIWLNYKYEHKQDDTIWGGILSKKNFWIYGPPGTGKSRWAWQQQGAIYVKLQNKWWDGFHYADYNIVLIEDWGADKGMLAPNLKQWSDRYKFIAEIKGGRSG